MKQQKITVIKKKKLPGMYVLCVLLGMIVAFIIGYFVYVGFNYK